MCGESTSPQVESRPAPAAVLTRVEDVILCSAPRIPTGFHHSAQGCEERATLGNRANRHLPEGVESETQRPAFRFNPFGNLCKSPQLGKRIANSIRFPEKYEGLRSRNVLSPTFAEISFGIAVAELDPFLYTAQVCELESGRSVRTRRLTLPLSHSPFLPFSLSPSHSGLSGAALRSAITFTKSCCRWFK